MSAEMTAAPMEVEHEAPQTPKSQGCIRPRDEEVRSGRGKKKISRCTSGTGLIASGVGLSDPESFSSTFMESASAFTFPISSAPPMQSIPVVQGYNSSFIGELMDKFFAFLRPLFMLLVVDEQIDKFVTPEYKELPENRYNALLHTYKDLKARSFHVVAMVAMTCIMLLCTLVIIVASYLASNVAGAMSRGPYQNYLITAGQSLVSQCYHQQG